jgi:hypothetical protein
MQPLAELRPDLFRKRRSRRNFFVPDRKVCACAVIWTVAILFNVVTISFLPWKLPESEQGVFSGSAVATAIRKVDPEVLKA